jgi:hypothetical protein
MMLMVGCSGETRWYKGNLHTHSLWSDGDDFPEMIIDWYKQSGYDFIALSDHNILAQHEKWIDTGRRRSSEQAYQKYLNKMGDAWVEAREESSRVHVRLKTFDEYRSLFEEPGRFLVIQSEEITDDYEGYPVHINATNIAELITPQGGASVHDVMQNNIDAVLEQRRRTNVAMFPHINHPNYNWAVSAQDLMTLRGEQFFEVYNGHPAVHNEGDDLHPSTDRLWDIVLSYRISNGLPVMYGLATDDAHNYHEMTSENSNPGRGWVMVKAKKLTREAVIKAMESGDFYATSGVSISSITRQGKEIRISIASEDGVKYTTQFIGTSKSADLGFLHNAPAQEQAIRKGSEEIGAVLLETNDRVATYRLNGNELYVRAKITSSKLKRNPYRAGEYETAWTQPVVPER